MNINISKCHLIMNKKDVVIMRTGDTETKNGEYKKITKN